ncbi:hypothetical protein B0T21DRAFT_413708 [Apiosordaria backusii]|uniref:F-box domain-containing protein n=1 Tax=Apiosordaria backusii TaxID=314023 RepID=A0AA40B2D0_9PEZI|nr:hypothetical protein B0T21DRAFT_413708 [Apiosordaria backusii]
MSFLDSLPLEIINNILLHMPLKDALALRKSVPVIWRAYVGEDWANFLHRRLYGIEAFATLADFLIALNPHQEGPVSMTTKLTNLMKQPTTHDLERACELLDIIDELTTNFTNKALDPAPDVRESYRALPGWPLRPLPNAADSVPERHWAQPSDLSFAEQTRLRHTVLYLSVICSIERRVSSLGAGPLPESEKVHFLRQLATKLPKNFPPYFIEGISCLYTYLYLGWKAIICATKYHVGDHDHEIVVVDFEQERDFSGCVTCRRAHDQAHERAHAAAKLGPEALYWALKLPLGSVESEEGGHFLMLSWEEGCRAGS